MEDGIALNISFLFIDHKDCGVYFCRSFFPMDKKDYTKKQAQYTLLKKEKTNLQTGKTVITDMIVTKSSGFGKAL